MAGLLFALAAAASWAIYILLSAATGRRFPGSSGLTVAMAVAALAVTPVGVAAGGRSLLRPGVLATGAGIGLLSSIIPYSLELETLRRVPAKVFGIWMSVEPAVAALVGLVMLSQSLSLAGVGRHRVRHGRLRRRRPVGQVTLLSNGARHGVR